MSTSNKAPNGKRRYAAPSLTLYGSVSDLTGSGSGTQMGDAGDMMT